MHLPARRHRSSREADRDADPRRSAGEHGHSPVPAEPDAKSGDDRGRGREHAGDGVRFGKGDIAPPPVQVGEDPIDHRRDECADRAEQMKHDPMLATTDGASVSRTAALAEPSVDCHEHHTAADRPDDAFADEAGDDDAERDRAGVQADRTVAERQLVAEEGQDIALDADDIGEVAEEQVAIPGKRIPSAMADAGGVEGCVHLGRPGGRRRIATRAKANRAVWQQASGTGLGARRDRALHIRHASLRRPFSTGSSSPRSGTSSSACWSTTSGPRPTPIAAMRSRR